MLATYQRLQAEGKIGPFDAEGRPRPWQEYPKRVRSLDGSDRVVNSAREEVALAADTSAIADSVEDPMVGVHNALRSENVVLQDELTRLRAELAAQAGGQTVASGKPVRPPIESPKAPEGKSNG